jgi:ABC-type Zn uptake system ZnuABC Zn-binding protein ZnuA
VAVSIPPQKWLVEQVAGAAVSVSILVEPGRSPARASPRTA